MRQQQRLLVLPLTLPCCGSPDPVGCTAITQIPVLAHSLCLPTLPGCKDLTGATPLHQTFSQSTYRKPGGVTNLLCPVTSTLTHTWAYHTDTHTGIHPPFINRPFPFFQTVLDSPEYPRTSHVAEDGLVYAVLGCKPRAFCMLGKHSIN